MTRENVKRTALGTNVNDELKKQFKITMIKNNHKLVNVLETFMKTYIERYG